MQHVDIKIHGEIGTVLLDRPAVHHALSQAMMEDLQTAFSDLHQEKRVRSVVLTAGGQNFCSGVDLSILKQINETGEMERLAECHRYWNQFAGLIEQMLRFPKPVIAAVDGQAIGAGLAIALACDMIVATDRAGFTAPAAGRGLVGGITAVLLSFRLGAAAAAKLVMTGTPITADEAFRLSLCEQPVAPEQVWVAASTLAGQCSAGPSEAVQAAKRVLNETVGEALFSQLAAAAAASATACHTDAGAEGIDAFLQKRQPSWP